MNIKWGTSFLEHCCLFIVIYAVLNTSTSGICFCIAVCGVLFVDCWITQSAATPLYHFCVTVKKMSPSEVNLPCDIILMEWSSSYVALTIKCVFILIMVRFFSLCETKYETPCTQLVENVCDIKYCVCKKHTAVL